MRRLSGVRNASTWLFDRRSQSIWLRDGSLAEDACASEKLEIAIGVEVWPKASEVPVDMD